MHMPISHGLYVQDRCCDRERDVSSQNEANFGALCQIKRCDLRLSMTEQQRRRRYHVTKALYYCRGRGLDGKDYITFHAFMRDKNEESLSRIFIRQMEYFPDGTVNIYE